jgi:hypothetical protein
MLQRLDDVEFAAPRFGDQVVAFPRAWIDPNLRESVCVSNPSRSVIPISGGTYTVAKSIFSGTSITVGYVETPSTDVSFGLIGMTL